MTTHSSIANRLAAAVALRESGRDDEALSALLELQRESPGDALVNLQCAWIHDKLGLEREAVPFYERALELGLAGQDLHDALLGLGSTYRALGRYDEALSTLSRGVTEFPQDRGLQVFQAMAFYNKGRPKDACELLLTIIAETTAENSVATYRRAIAEYAADLDRTW
jgi:tetratricopeptide (TPR) repeat protein